MNIFSRNLKYALENNSETTHFLLNFTPISAQFQLLTLVALLLGTQLSCLFLKACSCGLPDRANKLMLHYL